MAQELPYYAREGAGRVRVRGEESSNGLENVAYELSSEGQLAPSDAREVANALRRGGESLALLIGDDPEDVAAALEEAADALD